MTDSAGNWGNRYQFSPDTLDREALNQWAGDRDRYFTFSVNITQSSVHNALESVRAVLADHDCTTVAPPEYYHITLKQVGCIREPPERESDITPTTLSKLRQAARAALSDIEPFDISLPRLNIFDRVIFCEVAECERLKEIHRRLCNLPDVPQWEFEQEDYVPHMTLSHFQSCEGIERMFTDLDPLRDVEIPPIRVESVYLEEFHPAELYPTRSTVEEFEL